MTAEKMIQVHRHAKLNGHLGPVAEVRCSPQMDALIMQFADEVMMLEIMEHTILRHRSFIECTIAGTERTINMIDKTLDKNESAAFLKRLNSDSTTQDKNACHKFPTIGLFKGLSKRAISKCHQLLGPSSQL